MRIVIDGDSVALDRPDNWPFILRTEHDLDVICLASHQAITTDILHRLNDAIKHSPEWYYLQLGQWSCNHQSYFTFRDDLSHIVAKLHGNHIKVCLMTPPPAFKQVDWTSDVIREVSTVFNCGLIDVHKRMKDNCDSSYFLPETVSCHFSRKGSLEVISYFVCMEQFYRAAL